MAAIFSLPFADVGNGITSSAGAKLEFFDSSNPAIQRTIWSESTETVPNERANPVVANGEGVFPAIFISGSYKVTLKDANDVDIWEDDPVVSIDASSIITTNSVDTAAIQDDAVTTDKIADGAVTLAKLDDDLTSDVLASAINSLTVKLTNPSNTTVTFSAGFARDLPLNGFTIELSLAFTKQINAPWAVGTGVGGFPSGASLTANTTYHLFAISKTDGTADAGYDDNLSATNLLADATGYTKFRRIGSCRTDGSSNILGFFHFGNEFYLKDRPESFNSGTTGSVGSRTAIVMTVPFDIQVIAHVQMNGDTTSQTDAVILTSLSENAQTPVFQGLADIKDTGTLSGGTAKSSLLTNTAGEIGWQNLITGGGNLIFVKVWTIGWTDLRES